MTDERDRRVLRLKSLAAVLLAEDGLRPPNGWSVDMLPNGVLAIHDPSSPDGNIHGRLRAGMRIDCADKMADAALAQIMARQARSALRRERTYSELRRQDQPAAGWAALAHPLAIAMARHAGITSESLPPRRLDPKDSSRGVLLETAITWDQMSVNIDMVLQMGGRDMQTRLKSAPGRTTLLLDAGFPATLLAALRRRPLAHLVSIPVLGDTRIDAAIANLRIEEAVPADGPARPDGGNDAATTITLAPTAWLPWGMAPDDIQRLVDLSPEVS